MAIINGYATLIEFKDRLFAVGEVDSAEDAKMEQIVTAVSRQIDGYCQRRFYAATQTRYFSPLAYDIIFVDDLLSVTTLKTDTDGDHTYETTWATTDYDLEPFNAALESQIQPYTAARITRNGRYRFPLIPRSVEIAGSWGYSSATPPAIKEACLLQSLRLFKRKDAIFGIVGSAEMGQLLVIPKLDPDVALLLGAFVKRSGMV